MTSSIARRVERLERSHPDPAQPHRAAIRVVGPPSCSDERLDAFLKANGIERVKDDLVIYHAIVSPAWQGHDDNARELTLLSGPAAA